MVLFTFLVLVPVPVELGKIAASFLKLGKIINHNSEEKNDIKVILRAIFTQIRTAVSIFPFMKVVFLFLLISPLKIMQPFCSSLVFSGMH